MVSYVYAAFSNPMILFLLVHYVGGNWAINPCGGGVEYLHREPASRKRRRNVTKKGRAIA
jgi:hypothetical protein